MKSGNGHIAAATAALALVACGAQPGLAQGGNRNYEHPLSRLDVDFPGGTVAEYVGSIRRSMPGSAAANIVVMPDARDLKVPPVKLVAVTVEAAVQVLEGPYTLPDRRRAEISVRSYPIAESSDLVLKVVADFEATDGRSAVWGVEEALSAGQSAEDLLGAIEAVLTLFSQRAEISFHPPTRLLIARGTHEQIDLVESTLQQLMHNAARRGEEMESIHRQIDSLDEELHHVKAEMRITEQETALQKTRLESAIKAREQGNASAEDVGEHELEVMRSATRVDMMKERRARLESKLKSLRASLAALKQPRE